ncbi:prepilin-type N-terminal cleavage/methylation domain-containing protein [Persephonella sp.]
MAGKVKGFSIIELLIVIVILLIISAIAVIPFLDKIEANKIDRDIRAIYGLLQEGRIKAFGEKRRFIFELNPLEKRACLIDPVTNTEIRCVGLNKTDYNPIIISIDKRGTFSNGTIIYTGDNKSRIFSCISISTTRVKMGEWNGTDCIVK